MSYLLLYPFLCLRPDCSLYVLVLHILCVYHLVRLSLICVDPCLYCMNNSHWLASHDQRLTWQSARNKRLFDLISITFIFGPVFSGASDSLTLCLSLSLCLKLWRLCDLFTYQLIIDHVMPCHDKLFVTQSTSLLNGVSSSIC